MLNALTVDLIFFFFNDTATTEIYTLSLHDALPIYRSGVGGKGAGDDVEQRGLAATVGADDAAQLPGADGQVDPPRSEEHTSELQSPCNLVCRLLLEKKKRLIHSHSQQAVRLSVRHE